MISIAQNAHAISMWALGLGFIAVTLVLVRQSQANGSSLTIPRGKTRIRLILITLLATTLMASIANSVLVLNGTTSLPHHGYYMLRMPLILRAGQYVSFNTPQILKGKFERIAFVKRIAGVPGDEVVTTENTVCINGECRELQPELVAAGFKPLKSGRLEADQYVVFGDSVDSLDSRYQAIGTIPKSEIIASGWAIPIMHWKELAKWISE